MDFITLTKDNISSEHICCALADKKCKEGYELKKAWLAKEFDNGYVFRRLDARAKVFIEYVPAERAWIAVDAQDYLMINCLWVSGQYKGHGYAKALLQSAVEDARREGKRGLVTVVGTKKLPFMCEPKWLLGQGFVTVDKLDYGFSLLALSFDSSSTTPSFRQCVRSGECDNKNGLTVYYTNRCPFTDFYVNHSLPAVAAEHGVELTVIKLENMAQAQSAPTPATIFSAFMNGKFLTTDMGICVKSRFEKIVASATK